MTTFSKFSSLLNEMMLNIIETTNPKDIESLAWYCKLVHTLAGKTQAQHKADKDRWWQIRFCVTWFYPDAECLEAFIRFRDIAINRRLQRYPKEVTFHDRDFTGHRVSPFVALDIKTRSCRHATQSSRTLSLPTLPRMRWILCTTSSSTPKDPSLVAKSIRGLPTPCYSLSFRASNA